LKKLFALQVSLRADSTHYLPREPLLRFLQQGFRFGCLELGPLSRVAVSLAKDAAIEQDLSNSFA